MTGIGFVLLVVAIVVFVLHGFGVLSRRDTMAIGLSALIGCNLVLLLISRQYTTRLQDRVIKLEMRVRGASLLTPSQQATLAKLDKPQVIALRFASDAELAALVEQAEREHLSADQIKRAVKNWVPDWDRT